MSNLYPVVIVTGSQWFLLCTFRHERVSSLALQLTFGQDVEIAVEEQGD